MSPYESFDIAVIGAGPCGLSVGVAARKAGLSCILFDKGCITQAIVNFPLKMTFFSTADRLELGGVPFIVPGDKPARVDALKYYRAVADRFDLDVRQYEEVVDIEGEQDDFVLRTRGRGGEDVAYAARSVVVATGYFDTPNLMDIPGEDLPKVLHYYREGYAYFDQDCVVIGAGNSAVDAALDLYRSGARVTLVHFEDDLDSGVKPWVLPDIRNRLDKGQIEARWRTRVMEVRPGSVVLRDEDTGAVEELDNDWVFAMTGYTPDPKLLRTLGVSIDPETGIPAHDPETMATDVPGVYIAGVIAAGYNANKIFIENGREHGGRIVDAVRREVAGRRDDEVTSARGVPAG